VSDSLFGSPPSADTGSKGSVLTVSRLNALVKSALEQEFSEIAVRGEISNVSIPASGHAYFTLKDENAEISAVWFRGARIRSRFDLREGDAVILRGSVSLYAPRGTYQIIVKTAEPEGKGDLRERFEKLARKLRDEGIFDEQHKKPIPLLPGVIGIITSKTGAAVRDITNVIWSRFPGAHIVLGPVPVQGKDAPGEICAMISRFNAWGKADVLIVGRGGGSLEDLWAFNEESVARAIFESEIPIISAVGHETDITISDLAADVRALTPTQAGEFAVPDTQQENQKLDLLLTRNRLSMTRILSSLRDRLERYTSHRIFETPKTAIRMKLVRSTELARRLSAAGAAVCETRHTELSSCSNILETLNPLSVLKRGFSYTSKDGVRVTEADSLAPGDIIATRFHRGSITSAVTKEKKHGRLI